jgi:hypothetical protein
MNAMIVVIAISPFHIDEERQSGGEE